MIDTDTLKSLEKKLENLEQNILISAKLHQATLQNLITIKDLNLNYQTDQIQANHPNPLNKFGGKCFSQTDEDGITLEIVRRLNIFEGVYAEFGVGNGLENNTLILASLGWKGFWVGGEDLAFDYSKAQKFKYIKGWITLDTILEQAKLGLKMINTDNVDVVSIDLDGNDIYFAEKLLKNGIHPRLFIVEYNAKFIPPSKFQIMYNSEHRWVGDDYFGASLTNFDEMFKKYGYKLVCCNSHTGANAFFIRKDYEHLFSDVPEKIVDIYSPPRYYLYHNFGHKISSKVVEEIINK